MTVSKRLLSFIGLGMLAVAVGAVAQEAAPTGDAKPQTQVQIDNAESTSKPDDVQIPEANPARPTITNPAHIPPVGYLQFEQGFLQAGNSPDELSRQSSLVQTTKLSLHPRLMVQFSSQPIAVSSVSNTTQADTGDLIVGVQGLLVKEVGQRPTVALGYLQRVRSGTAPDIDVGSFSRSALVLISGDLGAFHYDTNFSVSEQSSDPVRRAQYGRTLSVTHDLFSEAFHAKLAITGEIWNFTQPLVDTTRSGAASPRSEAVGMVWALGYSVRPNIVLDGGFDRGLTSTATAWQGFAGFTYLLPHRLWAGSGAGAVRPGHKHIHHR